LPLLEKIEDLTDEITALKAKEQKLMQEIKKRGDLARQLCGAKDEEIKQLREKLHFDQRQHQTLASSASTSPVGKLKKSLTSEDQEQQEAMNNSSASSGPSNTSSPIKNFAKAVKVDTEQAPPNPQHSHVNGGQSDLSSLDSLEEEVSNTISILLLSPTLCHS
jgi:hypothetical protein